MLLHIIPNPRPRGGSRVSHRGPSPPGPWTFKNSHFVVLFPRISYLVSGLFKVIKGSRNTLSLRVLGADPGVRLGFHPCTSMLPAKTHKMPAGAVRTAVNLDVELNLDPRPWICPGSAPDLFKTNHGFGKLAVKIHSPSSEEEIASAIPNP